MENIKSLAIPLVVIMVLIPVCAGFYILWTASQIKKMTRGKIKAYILLENKTLWKGLCDYIDTRVRAPWYKGDKKDDKDRKERVQVFHVTADQIWYDVWPEKGMFQQTVPAAFFHEREINAIFPPAPCDCGHPECNGKRVPELTPSQLGLMQDEHVTEAALRASLWVKGMLDQLGGLANRLLPGWVTLLGFGILILAIIVIGVLLYTMRSDIAWLKDYLAPMQGMMP